MNFTFPELKQAILKYVDLKEYRINPATKSAIERALMPIIVQMYGRAIRSPTDYAKFYIIDGSFKNLPKKDFPQWFLNAIVD